MIKACMNPTATWLLAIVLSFAVSGCVTRTSGPEVDREQALDTHIQLAMAYIENRNRESARHHLRRAFELNRDSAKAIGAQAMLYQLEGEDERAEESFKRALQQDRSFTQARNNYAAFLYKKERYKEALEQFELVADDLDYNNRARALLNLGRSALQLGHTARAHSAFEQAYTLDRSMPAVLIELAELNFNQEDYAEAKRYLDQYAALTRQSARSLLLGIKIERIFGNRDQEASYVMALKNRFPYSNEYLEYQRELSN